MSSAFDERVLDYVLGALDEEETLQFEREMERSAALRAMCREAEELLVLSAEALAPVAPSPDLKLRVMEATVPSAWLGLVDRVARVWDLTVGEVRRTLARAMDSAEWEAGPVRGVSLFHLEGGPSTAGADVGIVRFEAGLPFPNHGHGGDEDYVLLEGVLHDSSGQVEHAGDVVGHGGDEIHSFLVDPSGPAYLALVLRGPLRFDV